MGSSHSLCMLNPLLICRTDDNCIEPINMNVNIEFVNTRDAYHPCSFINDCLLPDPFTDNFHG